MTTQKSTTGKPARTTRRASGTATKPNNGKSASSNKRPSVIIWTDGSALANPKGAMGWAWVDNKGHKDAGGAAVGTNQIGELTAILMALMAHQSGDIEIRSDSEYAINVSEKWSKGWKRNDWKLRDGSPVKNLPLVKSIRRMLDAHEGKVIFTWVKGHSGVRGNEIVDTLAREFAIQRQNGEGSDRMPPEGVKALEESDAVNGVERKRTPKRGLYHRPGDSKDGHWKMVRENEARKRKYGDYRGKKWRNG